MATYGFKLMAEGMAPRALVEAAKRAEDEGFDFVTISDHYHPWLPEQEHSAFAWTILGAIANATSTIRMSPGVTCPFLRYHPAIIAQAAATLGVLSEGRAFLQLGAGERLNEHVVGVGWPAVSVRHQMLEEAIDIIRLLWQGGYQSYDGSYLTLEDARVFDLPDPLPELFVAISGPASARSPPPVATASSRPSRRPRRWRRGSRRAAAVPATARSDWPGTRRARRRARSWPWSTCASPRRAGRSWPSCRTR